MKEKGEKKIMALEVELRGAGRRGVPGKQTLGKARKGRVWKQEAGREGGKTSSSFNLADTKLTEEGNKNQGLDNKKASHC